jgi:hypothetical protein
MHTVENHSQIWPETIETPVLSETIYSWNEGELEQRAQLLIARCYQILAEMQEKRDRIKLPA